MSYITGTISDFASRLHSLPTTTGDLTTGYIVEGRNYLAIVGPQTSGQWENEIRKQSWLLTADPLQMLSQKF
jgi:hypothetical protein